MISFNTSNQDFLDIGNFQKSLAFTAFNDEENTNNHFNENSITDNGIFNNSPFQNKVTNLNFATKTHNLGSFSIGNEQTGDTNNFNFITKSSIIS
jgi:hypothetical protein